MPFLRTCRRSIERLRPYPSLVLLGVPLVLAESLKLASLAVVGNGHWMIGVIVMLVAYALSLFLVERLFVLVKPKLLRLRWFHTIWTWFVAVRRKTYNWLVAKMAPEAKASPEA